MKSLAIFVFGSVLFIAPVLAHDAQMRGSMYSGWMENLESKKGLCCSANEGSTVKDVDWTISDGLADAQGHAIPCVKTPIDAAHPEYAISKYCVRLDGTWWFVPESALVLESNKYGPAVVWPIWTSHKGAPNTLDGIRCFMPGALT